MRCHVGFRSAYCRLSKCGILFLTIAQCNCGILYHDIGEPEMSWKLGRDPKRITQWAMAQTKIRAIDRGTDALLWLATAFPSKSAEIADGYVKIYRKVEAAWPSGIVDKYYLWIMREKLAQLVNGRAAKPILAAYREIGPPGDRPEGHRLD